MIECPLAVAVSDAPRWQVKSFGTEGRKKPEIAPSNEIYQFIIFRGKDIKDLTVLSGQKGGPSQDPAIVSCARELCSLAFGHLVSAPGAFRGCPRHRGCPPSAPQSLLEG